MDPDSSFFRNMAAEACIGAIRTASELVDTARISNLRFHFATFALFDTGTIICSAILHEGNHTLPSRSDLLRHLGQAQQYLCKISRVAHTANNSTTLLTRLIQALPLSSQDKTLLHNTSDDSDSAPTSTSTSTAQESTLVTKAAALTGNNNVLDIEPWAGDATDPINLETFDLDGIQQIWDWETLGLNIC